MSIVEETADDWVFPVEKGAIMLFARALGDTSPAYVDPSSPAALRAGGIPAPPTFTISAEHYRPNSRLRPSPGTAWRGSGAGDGTPSSGGGGLHAEQHFEYVRPLLAGEELVVTDTGIRTWVRKSRGRAELHFSERSTTYLDADGLPVVVERRTTVTRIEAPVTDAEEG